MPNKMLKKHYDRCCNPYDRKGHVGKGLRSLSTNLRSTFPNLPENSKICADCRIFKTQCSNKSIHLECNENALSNDCMDTSSPSINIDSEKRSNREIELEEIVDSLKEKFASLSITDPLRLSILTLLPSSWSINKIAEEFSCSKRLARQAKELKASKGILAETTSKSGKKISEETVQKIQEFYESDSNSRIMPGVKDVISVKVDGIRILMQKRLLLLDLNSLYSTYKELYPDYPVSFSKFAQMRPKHCILMGNRGTHTVCVCTIHQNVKLMFEAIDFETLTNQSEKSIKNYKDSLSQIMCRNANAECQLDECEKCPGTAELSNDLLQCLQDNNILQVEFSQWTGTDRCTLNTHLVPSEEFIDELCTRLSVLKSHSFIANEQVQYFENRKNNLCDNEILVTFDFSENYKYVVQEAAQAFHFNNDQCTVFTVVCYFKQKSEVEHKSFVFISDCIKHDTSAVYTIQRCLIPEIKKILKVKKVIYFSDGAKQHFKNKYQIINLVNHENDFGIKAEWHYHATAHGKNACDGVGAIFKREAARASLLAKPTNAILTPERLLKWAKGHFKNIAIFFYSNAEHQKVKRKLKARFDSVPSVPQIQKNHSFTVLNHKKLLIKRFSNAHDGITLSY